MVYCNGQNLNIGSPIDYFKSYCDNLNLCSSRQALDESEVEAQERKSMRCIWVSGKKALTEREAAEQIVAEAQLLFQQDLALLGVEWNPASLATKTQPDSHSPEESANKKPLQSMSRGPEHEEGQNVTTNVDKQKLLVDKYSDSCSHPPLRPLEVTTNSEKPMDIDSGVSSADCQPAKKCEQQSSTLHKVLKSINAKDKGCQNNQTAESSDCSSKSLQKKLGHNTCIKSAFNSGSVHHCVSPVSKRRRMDVVDADVLHTVSESKTPALISKDPKLISNVEELCFNKPETDCRIDKDKMNLQSSIAALNQVIESKKGGEIPDVTVKKCTSKMRHLTRNEKRETVTHSFGKIRSRDETGLKVNTRVKHDLVCCSEKLSSPDLYTNGLEEFGDSFQLDTQTEKMLQGDDFSHGIGNLNILKENNNHVDSESEINVVNQSSFLENENQTSKDQNKDTVEGLSPHKNGLATEFKPKYNISLTDSQLENILTYSNQVTEEESSSDKPTEQRENHEPSDHVTDNSFNRSSSFLFDSLYDNSILDAMEEAAMDQDNKEEQVVEAHANSNGSSPELIPERKDGVSMEDQEAIQWGESSFNLSEWGDSLLIGEQYLDKMNNAVKAGDGPRLGAEKSSYTDDIVSELHVSQSNEPHSSVSAEKRQLNCSSFHISPGMQDIFDKWSDQFSTLSEIPGQSNSTVVEPNAAAVVEKAVSPLTNHGIDQGGPRNSRTEDFVVVQAKPVTHNDLVPPTPVSEPVTPRVKMTTSAIQSPLNVTKHRSELDPNSKSSSQKDYQSCLRTNAASELNMSLADEGFTRLSQCQSLPASNSCSPETFSIIDVASDKRLFHTFIKEWKTKDRFSLALACEKIDNTSVQAETVIGVKFKKRKTSEKFCFLYVLVSQYTYKKM